MSDWRPRDPAGADTGRPPPPGWGTPFPPEKPRRDAPQGAVAPQAPAVTPYQGAPYGAAPAGPPPYGASQGAPTPPSPAYGAGFQPYGAAPATAAPGAAPGVSPQYAGAAEPATPDGYSPHSFAAAAVPGVPLMSPLPDPMSENRRYLDWRRIRATRLDGILMIPVAVALIVLFRGHPVTAYFLILAINLSYHFVMETVCGQTFGKRWRNLRVVRRDGTAASASAIAARTVFRIIDAQFLYLVGLITMVITGKKRQRLGDLAGGTIVREDDRPWKPAPSSPLLVIYPVLWIGAALFFGQQFDPKPVTLTSDPYMQQVDRACEWKMFNERTTGGGGSFLQAQEMSLQETRAIEALPAPPSPDAAHGLKVVLKWRHKIDKTAARIVADARSSSDPPAALARDAPQLVDVVKQSNAHMAQLGLPHCVE